MDEQDIQKMIAMNRVTRLIHKMRFKARQRRTVSYFSKYVLSEKDIDDNKEPADVAEVLNYPTEKLYSEFDPENDPWDKRLLYEVTGLRID